jgi:hypothetical protein
MLTAKLGIALSLLFACCVPAWAQSLPKWLIDAKARESKPSPIMEVTSEDGWFTSKVPGRLSKKINWEDGGYVIGIELDGNVSVNCEVLKGSKDLATLMSVTADYSFKAIEKVNGTIEARGVESSDAGAMGGFPFITQSWLYRSIQNGERRVGALKQFVVALDAAVIYCSNEDVGYSKTFENVVKTFSTNFQGKDESAKPHYREVSVISLDGSRVGVATTTLTKDAEGDTKLVSMSAMLLQKAPGEQIAVDSVRIEWTTPDGALINAAEASVHNGESNEDMALKPIEGRWVASGTVAGKPIEAELNSAPSSFIQMALARRQLMALPKPEGAVTEAMAWSSADLSKLVSSRSTLIKRVGKGGFAVREELAGLTLDAVLDVETGTMLSAKLPIGPRKLDFERVSRSGSF